MRFGWARSAIRFTWVRLLKSAGCLWWAKVQLRRRGAVIVLTFHRVLDDHEFRQTCSLPGIVVRTRTFEKLAGYLAARNEPVDFERAVGQPPTGRLRVMCTFDDGWKDNHTSALGVARKHGLPLTIFVCPGLLDRAQPFWPERVIAALRSARPEMPLAQTESLVEAFKNYTPEQRESELLRLGVVNPETAPAFRGDRTVSLNNIREMHAAGVRFGSHTQTHQILTSIGGEEARRELCESKRALEAALHRRCDLFAYPNGNHSPSTREWVADEGYTAAFTTDRGAWVPGTDNLAIPRINVCESKVTDPAGRFSPALFEYAVIWKAWRALRATRARAPQASGKPAFSHA